MELYQQIGMPPGIFDRYWRNMADSPYELKKRNPQDTTLRNLRAQKKKLAELEKRLKRVEVWIEDYDNHFSDWWKEVK